ncbi:hypothetical protein FB45DRAFT_733343 [Roridomyces roridus]|uniref:Uncharacterized protein n=1 Tax=Roridomyces roridus TaxID=1738132 RepID=A0AAD7CFW7_9AGAR|nr:hypothetical protein FB45DRAFT_733343 [Roridomyces roridus]
MLHLIGRGLALLGTPVHITVFPYVWGTTFHAARISYVFISNGRGQTQLSWGAHLFGYLLMCWGGSLGAHLMLSLPPPQLYALGPWINYSTVHLLFTLLFHYFPLPDPSLTNTILFPLDGLLRANSVLHTLSLLSLPSVSPLLAASPLAHFILGAVASAGGGLLGGTLNLWTPNWQFSTPPPLRTGVWGVWSTLDIWAGGIVALTYGALTGHPALAPLRASLVSEKALVLTVSDARASAAALMIFFFGLRVAATLAPAPPKKVKTQ